MDYLMLLGGLCLLVASGEFLVRGAVYLASKMKVSSLVIGMTVVSFGTSAPELLVSLEAALNGHADICIGNIVGSNIANLALVLGLTAIVFPVVVEGVCQIKTLFIREMLKKAEFLSPTTTRKKCPFFLDDLQKELLSFVYRDFEN